MRECLSISLKDLKRLVTDLSEGEGNISIRYRLVGDMWYHNFVKVLQVDETGMTLFDESSGKRICIGELGSIVQFELDRRFRAFEAHCHYEVASGRRFVLY